MADSKTNGHGNCFQDLTGQQFGRLTVLGKGQRDRHGNFRWSCLCQCGRETAVPTSKLRAGHTKSCGCLHVEVCSKKNLTHGMTRNGVRTIEHRIWGGMITRCYNQNRAEYPKYGGRGITVCLRWRNSFMDFLADVGPCPGPGYSIDRINNDGNYEPSNVRWATQAEQSRNTRQNRNLTYGSRTMCLGDWAKELGINRSTLERRLARGWALEEALSTHGRKYPLRSS